MRIPITMSHGTNHWQSKAHGVPLYDAERFEGQLRIAAELGFQSISYDDLAAWRNDAAPLPERPIMFDFDHPNKAILPLWRLMERYGFKGNLFVNTSPMEKVHMDHVYMTWDELREVQASGWHIGSHTHNHMEMSYMARNDPSGGLIREQMEKCDAILREYLDIVPKDFAFTGTTWSKAAENVVKERYRFARLWIVGSHYDTDEGEVRYADMVGVPGDEEEDGGPPQAARYITEDTNSYRLPSMDLEYLVYEYDAFRRYLEGAFQVAEVTAEVT